MTIIDIVRQGFYYARTCRSLWLFGLFVGLASGGSNGGAGSGGNGRIGESSGGGLEFSPQLLVLILGVTFLALAVLVVLRFVSEGALIEGIVRARQGGRMTMREGFRAGWAHLGVLVRISLLYVAASAGSVVLLAAPGVLAWRALGPVGGLLLGIPAVVIAVPWLVTLYLVQAFAWRIAVIENRHALDALRKARLFLHGRLTHGLKLIVAMFLGTLGIFLLGALAMVPVALLLAALIPVLQVFPVIVLACLVLLPALCLLAAIIGTFRSSIWTIGYVTQVES